MRKRRVLALLLALSLVVGGNGMTVLAAEPGADMPVLTSQEETPETGYISGEQGVASDNDNKEKAEEAPETGDQSEEGKEPSVVENPSEESKTPENPGESDPPAPKEDAEQGSEQPSTEEGGDGKQEEASGSEEQAPSVSENDADADADEDAQETVAARPYVSRMVTFTDDIGMRVTYDANASQQYIYTVEDGVLTSVKMKSADPDGEAQTVNFEGNVELKQPEDGEQYTSIAAGVFGGNTKITYVKLPAGVTAVAAESFKGCAELKSVYLPSTVNTIGAGAFENCAKMTQISVPKAVTAIGDSAFKNDAKLHLVYIKDVDYCNLRTIGVSAFEGCATLAEFCSDREFVLPMKLESIGESAFKGCRTIQKADFTDTKLSAVGAHAFEGCTGLVDLWPGKTLTLISEYAFSGCTALSSINFVNGRNMMTIDHYAFQNCTGLKQLTLPQTVIAVRNYAFAGCTRLTRVELKCYNIEIGEIEAFPSNADGLVIIAEKDSNGYLYARRNKRLPTENAYYKYTVEDVNGVAVPDGKFPGGELLVTLDPASNSDINGQNGKKGVEAGKKCWVIPKQSTDTQRKNYTFIAGSLRCNGSPMEKENQKYFFLMPEGGAVITAEFRANTPDKINGQTATVEFSAGVPLRNGEQDKNGYLGVELKVGQATRMFLLDANGESIPASKLKFSSKDSRVATVSSSGVITAAGTNGAEMATTAIEVRVIGGDGKEFTVTRTIEVKTAEAKSITLKATKYDSDMRVTGEVDGIQTAVISKTIVSEEPYAVTLKANVYDGEDNVGKNLTWTTSDAKVAAPASMTTEAKNPVNVVTIKKGCEGEATITVTANNAAGAEKKKVTQKFVIRVYREGYRLTTSSVTVNPNMKDGGSIELISTSGLGISSDEIRLYEEKKLTTTQFTTKFDSAGSGDNCKKFNIMPIASTLKNGTYKVRVGVGDSADEKNFLPLTITVKRTTPAPTIKFNSKKTKFNLFYRNGGVDADGNQTVVTTEITKLGDVKIEKVALEPLSQQDDDRLFVENFEIDNTLTNLSEGKVVIRRKDGNLKYTSKKKAAVTGNLVIYYEGFEDSAAKKMKVTMPTCTTAPSYALRAASATYHSGCTTQEELLELYDKRSKTKEKVVLGSDDTVAEEKKDIILNKDPEIKDGAIALNFVPENGQFKLVLRNRNWDLDQNGDERKLAFTYKVKVSSTKPTLKTDKASVSLNLNYPEKEETFTLTSNQKGVNIGKNQTFVPVPTRTTAGEIGKLAVTYQNGEGTVKITDRSIKKGNYKFECSPQADWPDLKKVTLTVKVVDTKPTVTLGKGALQLNLVAFRNNSSAIVSTADSAVKLGETSEVSFKVNGVPDGYNLADVGAESQNTKVKCTSRGKDGLEDQFDFRVTAGNPEEKRDNMLSVSLKSGSVAEGTYSFSLTPAYRKEGVTTVYAKPVTVRVKVYSSDAIKLAVKASGKINLLNREGEPDTKNGIIYTPTLQNLKGEITDVRIYDGGSLDKESQYFDIEMITEGKNKGKFFVTPKKTEKTPAGQTPVEYEYTSLEYNKNYPVRIWVKVAGYAGRSAEKNGVMTSTIQIKASQSLPKVTTSRSALDVYLSTKNYDATFVVKPKAGSVGALEKVYFGEKDEKANESFELIQEAQKDGSMKVTVHLKEGVEYPNGSTNNVKMYVKYKGQGERTSATATAFNMKIKVN